MNIKSTKGKLLMSAVSLLVCMSMLVTSTFAWFTDTASSANNIIASGNLDVELYHENAYTKTLGTDTEPAAPVKVDENTTDLFIGADGNAMLWEPGAVAWENITIKNAGDLALVYQFTVTTANENKVVDAAGNQYGLSQILKVGIVPGGLTDVSSRTAVINAVNNSWKPITSVVVHEDRTNAILANSEQKLGVVVYWQPSDNDNNFNVNNGKTMISKDGQPLSGDAIEPLSVDLGITVLATQAPHESDSFGTDYDANAATDVFPTFTGPFTATTDITGLTDENGKLKTAVVIGEEGNGIYAIVPVGTMTTGSALTLTVDTTDRSDNIEMTRGQVSRSLDVHIDGITAENEVAATIALGNVLPAGYKDANVQLYHVENEEANEMVAVNDIVALSDHNEYLYNAQNGEVFVSMATFSEVTLVIDPKDPWDGTIDTEWYTLDATEFVIDTAEELAGLGAIVGGMAAGIEQDDFAGKTVKLDANLDLGGDKGKVWYPIGYYYNDYYAFEDGTTGIYSTVYSFEGTFDGQNNIISNIYQNTWDMKGDNPHYDLEKYQYYNDGMGLFGFVMNGTVKNLTVDHFESDGEFCTTGCVAAYASGTSTFENITIFNSNPRAYNVPNGGVVGYAYGDGSISFNNCKVGASNKISALWGSWDVACGGLLGRMSDEVQVNINGCEVAAQIDVFNDVCGNYQYYQYRYCGMLIGTVGSDGNPEDQEDLIDVADTYVHYGDWTNYYYCELVANSLASYTHEHQFSRLDKIKNLSEIYDGKNWIKSGNFLLINGDEKTCYHIVNDDGTLRQHTHKDAGDETVNGQTVLKEDNQIVCIPFKQLGTGYGWGATTLTGITVIDTAYTITYLDESGYYIDEVHVSVAEADKAGGYTTLDNYNDGTGREFDGWINSFSAKVEYIPAGNRTNYVLWVDWADEHVATFIDLEGNVLQRLTFTKKGFTSGEPGNPPDVNGLVTVGWEEYDLAKATGDITIKPVYECNPYVTLTPVDSDNDGVTNHYKVSGSTIEGSNVDIIIPESVNGIFVVEIESGAFEDGDLRDVYVPHSVTNIGKNAFCKNDDGFFGLGGEYPQIQIIFDGKKDDWNDITKVTGWDDNIGSNSNIVFLREEEVGYLNKTSSTQSKWEWKSGKYPDWFIERGSKYIN